MNRASRWLPTVAYVAVVLGGGIALRIADQHALCETRQQIWATTHIEVVALTKPSNVHDPRLTEQQRALRITSNADRANTRNDLLDALGDEPSC